MPERDLFANFERMRREMDELFGDVIGRTPLGPRRGFSPRVDVYYAGDPPRAVVKADIAGMEIDEIGLEIRGRQLLIAGERKPAEAGEHGKAAGARRLVITHISDELDWLWAVEEATDAFGAKVELASEGATYEL